MFLEALYSLSRETHKFSGKNCYIQSNSIHAINFQYQWMIGIIIKLHIQGERACLVPHFSSVNSCCDVWPDLLPIKMYFI